MESPELNWDDPNYVEPRYEQTLNSNKAYTTYGEKNDSRKTKRDNYQPRKGLGSKESPREFGSGSQRITTKTIDVQTDCFGLVIGRGGCNIQRVQNDYNVHVKLDKDQGLLKISGNSEKDVDDALDNIQSLLYKSSQKQHNYSNRRQHIDKNDFYNSGGQNKYRQINNTGYDNFVGQNSDDGPMEIGSIDWGDLNKKAVEARKARWAKCPPLKKNFYSEHPDVRNLTKKEVERIRQDNNNITVARVFQIDGEDENIPNPVYKFEHCFEEYPDLMEEIYKQNFDKPSPIQSQAWPILLKGEDMIGIAQTGTGKTLAFLLPAMIHTEFQTVPRRERIGPNVLILAPTRELALQIEKEVNKYSFRGMKAVCVYGGGDRREQISDVESGAEIIICTPGRLNDLIQAKVIAVESITYLVLDEADRMLDMGFEPQIRKVLLDIRPDRQTVMTSATWPPGVRRLAQSYMENPIQICVGSLDLAATHTVRQIVEIMDDGDKIYALKRFIKNMEPIDKIIIFCGKKVIADDLSSDLSLDGVLCQCIHGSRDQRDREQAISDITTGEVRILIATDVASRGLDIDDVTHVINFDFPRNIEEYVHRVGRTGRAGRTGTSISYVTRDDWGVAAELIKILEEANQIVPEGLLDMAKRFAVMKERRSNEMEKCGIGRRGGGRGGRGGGYRSNRY